MGLSFSDDYHIESKTVNEQGEIELTLIAKDKGVAYHKVTFWLQSTAPYYPIRSEYYSTRGKPLKKVFFKEYKVFDGVTKVHKLKLEDPVRAGHFTWMLFDNYKKETLTESMFSKEALKRL